MDKFAKTGRYGQRKKLAKIYRSNAGHEPFRSVPKKYFREEREPMRLERRPFKHGC
jgi:hypothetical protein